MNTRKKFYTLDDLDKRYGVLTFGKVLQSFRLCDEKSQKEYAKMLRISAANLCDLEKGRKIPSPKRAASIGKSLGITPALLIQLAFQDQLRQSNLDYKVTIAA